MSDILAKPASAPLRGEIEIPPDKSISHRGIIIGSLTKGKIKIENFSKGADCISTLNIFKDLGASAEFLSEKSLVLDFSKGLCAPLNPLDCGNSGTSMRLLTGCLAGQNFNSILVGDKSLSARPMKRVIEPLSLMGAKINSNGGHAPLEITGVPLFGINYFSKIASAQVKSSILLAGLNAGGETTVIEPYLSRNHTEIMLKYFEGDIQTGQTPENSFFARVKPSCLTPKNLFVPGDISSAAFFMVAAAIVKDSDIIIKNVGLNPARTGILDIMEQMGASIQILDKKTVNCEDTGDIRVSYSPDMQGIEIGGEIIPRLIDEIPVICVLAAFANGKTVIKNSSDLKNKESDRIFCTAMGLTQIGLDVEPTSDGFIINGKNEKTTAAKFFGAGNLSRNNTSEGDKGQGDTHKGNFLPENIFDGKTRGNSDTSRFSLQDIQKSGTQKPEGGAELEIFHDHRLAMSFYVASLAAKKPSLIKEFEWVNTSFPEFLELFGKLGA